MNTMYIELKKVLVALTFCLMAFGANAQTLEFEGVIEYQNAYTSKQDGLTGEELERLMGTKQEYFLAGANYKNLFNGAFIKTQIYNGSENKSYTLTAKSDTMYWEDYSINKDKAIRYELRKDTQNVQGFLCEVLVVYAPKSTTYYYFSRHFGVNPKLFAKHQFGNWHDILSRTKSIPLKIVLETDQFNMTSNFVSIERKKLDSKIFDLPDAQKTARATW